MSTGIYLFCLTPENSLVELKGTGIDGSHPLFAETIWDITAILSEITLQDFSGPESRKKMEDLAWIGPRVLCHEEVIMTVMHQGPVLPVRFGTVFSSIEALVVPLRRHRDALSKFFLDTASKKEWALKGYVDMQQARTEIMAAHLAAEKEQLAGLSPGKRYFLEQRIKGAVDRDVTSWLKGIGDDIVRFVQDMSSAFSERRLLSREVTGRDLEMFFHGAFLVPDRSVEVLQRMTDKWNAIHEPQGLHLEFSGPWPPYHFVPVLDPKEQWPISCTAS